MTISNTLAPHVIGPTCYKAPVRKLDGFSSCLLLADIEPQPHRIVRSYVKAYPPGSRGLVNDIIHWIICAALGLPQPNECYILLIEHKHLARWWPNIDWASGSDCELYLTFASVALETSAPKTVLGHTRLQSLKSDMLQWDKLCAAIAAHEWMGNADANFSNFFRLGRNRWALLDGGEILGGNNWTPETLAAVRYIHNKLLHLLFYNGIPTNEYVARIVAEAENHTHALNAALPYIMAWIMDLCGQDDAVAAKSWLTHRADESWMRERFGIKQA